MVRIKNQNTGEIAELIQYISTGSVAPFDGQNGLRTFPSNLVENRFDRVLVKKPNGDRDSWEVSVIEVL